MTIEVEYKKRKDNQNFQKSDFHNDLGKYISSALWSRFPVFYFDAQYGKLGFFGVEEFIFNKKIRGCFWQKTLN